MSQDTQEITRLFHPCQHRWHEHFAWAGPQLVGLTPIGQVTIAVLAINACLTLRQALIAAGLFPL